MKWIIFILLLASVGYSMELAVDVNQEFMVDVLYFDHNNTNGLSTFSTELINIGSLPMEARMKVDVFQNKSLKFTGWTESKILLPGSNGFFSLKWPSEEGSYEVRYRIYYGGEILEKLENITTNSADRESAFAIRSFTYGSFIMVVLESKQTLESIHIMPSNFPQGLLVTQATIKNIEAGKAREAVLFYDYPIPADFDLPVIIASGDGKYLDHKIISVKKRTDILGLLIDLLLGNF